MTATEACEALEAAGLLWRDDITSEALSCVVVTIHRIKAWLPTIRPVSPIEMVIRAESHHGEPLPPTGRIDARCYRTSIREVFPLTPEGLADALAFSLGDGMQTAPPPAR